MVYVLFLNKQIKSNFLTETTLKIKKEMSAQKCDKSRQNKKFTKPNDIVVKSIGSYIHFFIQNLQITQNMSRNCLLAYFGNTPTFKHILKYEYYELCIVIYLIQY